MDKDDLDDWCRRQGYQPIEFLNSSPAKLSGYRLCFNYYSAGRNGGASNIMESTDACVYGLLMEVVDDDLEKVRQKEGCPNYYYEISVEVKRLSESTIVRNVRTYKVVKHLEKAQHQPPTKYYLELITRNAKKHNFPIDYMRYLESFKTID